MGKDQHHSVSVRKIDNGYVMTRSTYKGRQVETEEKYLPSSPDVAIAVDTQKEPKPPTGGLGKAVKMLKAGC